MESEETTASAAGSTASHKSVTRILSSRGAWVVGILTALTIFFIDQGTKLLVLSARMQPGYLRLLWRLPLQPSFTSSEGRGL